MNSSRSLRSKSTVPSAILTVSCSKKHQLGQIWSMASYEQTGLVFLRYCYYLLLFPLLQPRFCDSDCAILKEFVLWTHHFILAIPGQLRQLQRRALMWTRRYPESQLGNYHVITIIAMLTFAVDSLMDWASLHQSGAQVVQIVTLVFPQLLRSLPHHLPLLCLPLESLAWMVPRQLVVAHPRPWRPRSRSSPPPP